ncbi:hypothetical protein OsI_12044 [Oryza sativa Indica Group]|uniref:Pentatricopeptide repeat-containing protein n=1 Tax=Oryza sativa subsp. indica TaxID=39946 RepID=A2XHZ5_ORYSI|nr:hypothetical protein OsI_12044 [Oryza sativa Indica Group]
MYLKCSSPEDARRAPYGPPSSPGTASTGVAEALALFDQMTRVDGLRPNDVTFLAVLLACVHAWLVDQGLRHFSSMSSDYGLTLRSEHYAAAVDMLARVGRLRDAYEPAGLPGALGGPGRAARRWQEARRRESGRARRAALLPAAAGERRQFEGLANLSNGGALVMQTSAGGRYSLLVHHSHSVEELREFGLTDDMIEDQKIMTPTLPYCKWHNICTSSVSWIKTA